MSAATPAAAQVAPLVSVITAVRNGEKYLPETLQSVLTQTYARVEHLVIDGGSSDATVDIIRAHAPKLAYWISEPDAGIADAFNKGVVKATGDYLLFLNSDDVLAQREAIATMAEAAVGAGLPGLIYGDCMMVSREDSHP